MVRSRFGVERCCCPGEPDICHCECVCAYPFAFYDPLLPFLEYRGLWRDRTGNVALPIGDAGWTVVYWTNECNQQVETGWHYHQFNEPEQPTTVWMYAIQNTQDPNLVDQRFAIEVREEETGNVEIDLFGVGVSYPGQISGCKMRVYRYRRILDDVTDFWVPEINTTIYVPSQPTKYSNTTDALIPEPTEDIGYFPSDKQNMYLGGLFPEGDPRHNPNLPGTSACISNLQLYSRWLGDDELDDLWNFGQGLNIPDTLTIPDLIEHWCASDDWQDAFGSLHGTRLEHEGPIWDNNGDQIEDGQGAFIHGIN